MALEIGSVFAGYRILRLLGAGGMGTVYLARHPRLPRNDALKFLSGELAQTAEFRARFEREADIAGGLSHANIVSVYDRGVTDNQLWIAMQYIEGTDVAELIKAGPQVLTPQRTIAIVSDAARGLDYAHRHGLLHRDVKPANILVRSAPEEPSGEQALITDFGIARTVNETQHFTVSGDIVATLAYAPPEQLEGGDIDHRADVYALGCTLFEMLTGSKPFQRPNMLAMINAHMTAPPPRATERMPALPPAIDAVIARALSKNPAGRYNSCRELANDAARAIDPSFVTATSPMVRSQPVAPPLPVNLTKPPQRSRRPLIIGAAVAAALAVVTTGVVLVAMNSKSDNGGGGGGGGKTTSVIAQPTTTAPTKAKDARCDELSSAQCTLVKRLPTALGSYTCISVDDIGLDDVDAAIQCEGTGTDPLVLMAQMKDSAAVDAALAKVYGISETTFPAATFPTPTSRVDWTTSSGRKGGEIVSGQNGNTNNRFLNWGYIGQEIIMEAQSPTMSSEDLVTWWEDHSTLAG